jgi:hypothetical protein
MAEDSQEPRNRYDLQKENRSKSVVVQYNVV